MPPGCHQRQKQVQRIGITLRLQRFIRRSARRSLLRFYRRIWLFHQLIGVDGPLIGPSPKFDSKINSVNLRCTPRSVFRKDLDNINVIIGEVKEGLPTITKVIDVFSQSINSTITPGNSLNGEGSRIKIAGTEGNTVGFFFINAKTDAETAVPMTSVSRNDPSFFTFIIPQLPDGKYYLEIATQYGGNSKTLLKEPRRNRLPYQLTVGKEGEDDRPVIE